nr:ribonuclease H-like domain-containing protein [Tanacetum cinerariifolium]
KRDFSIPRTPQQNGIAERKNKTFIEAVRTMLADSLLPIPFWAEETLHVNFMENKPNVAGSGPAWLFDIDSLSQTMNYHPVLTENQTNSNTDAHTEGKEYDNDVQKSVSPEFHSSSCRDQTMKQGDKSENKDKGKSLVVTITGFRDLNEEFEKCINNSSNEVNAAGSSVSAAGLNFTNNTNDFSIAGPSNAAMPNLEDLSHNADDVEEPKRVHQALKDPSWIEAMQEELLQFKMQKVWILVDLPYGKRAIGFGPAWLFDIDSLSQTMNYHPVLAENQTNYNVGFQDLEKAEKEGTQTYSVSPDIHSSSYGDQAREQGDKAVNKDKVFVAGLDFINNTNDFTVVGPLVSAAELNFTNNTNDFSAASSSNAAMPNLEDLSHNAELKIKVEYHRCSMKTFIPACLLASCHKRSPKESIKLSRIQVGLKPCKKSSFSSRCRKFGSWWIHLMERGQLVLNGFIETKKMKDA